MKKGKEKFKPCKVCKNKTACSKKGKCLIKGRPQYGY